MLWLAELRCRLPGSRAKSYQPIEPDLVLVHVHLHVRYALLIPIVLECFPDEWRRERLYLFVILRQLQLVLEARVRCNQTHASSCTLEDRHMNAKYHAVLRELKGVIESL